MEENNICSYCRWMNNDQCTEPYLSESIWNNITASIETRQEMTAISKVCSQEQCRNGSAAPHVAMILAEFRGKCDRFSAVDTNYER